MASAVANRIPYWNRSGNNHGFMEALITPAEEKRYAELQTLALDAARRGDSPVLASMVRAGLPVNLRDHKGNTLLMLASYHGHEEIAAALLDCGAEPDRRNDRGQTPLGGVAFKGYVEIARLLLDAGADLDADQGGGATPLMMATLFGRTGMSQLLRQRGASLNVREGRGFFGGFLPLVAWAVSKIRRPADSIPTRDAT
jgi:ankyrin repeat protein